MYPILTEETLDYFGKERIVRVLNDNPSARGNLYGYMAEDFLREQLSSKNEVLSVTKIPDRNARKGDLLLVLKTGKEYSIEVKMIHSHSIKYNYVNGGVQGYVGIKSSDSKLIPGTDIRTSSMSYGAFDLLAVAYLEDGRWNFRFMAEKRIPASSEFPGRMSTGFQVNAQNTLFLYTDVFDAISDIS